MRLNLGEVLRGDRIIASDMILEMGRDKKCAMLCQTSVTKEELEKSQEVIRKGYQVEWIVDNLPGGTTWVADDEERRYYSSGFDLGFTQEVQDDEPAAYLNNHFTIVIRHRRAPGRAGARGESLIVGFEIYPKSLGPAYKRDKDGCPVDFQGDSPEIPDKGSFELIAPPEGSKSSASRDYLDPDDDGFGKTLADEDEEPELIIPYTYSVYFKEDETIEWSHRWDRYLDPPGTAYVHQLAIVNSLIICAMLTGVVLIILAKTVRSDINKINKHKDAEGGRLRKMTKGKGKAGPNLLGEEAAEEDGLSDDEGEALEDITGWKLLHGDVFRAPSQITLLAPLIGSGTQLLFTTVSVIILSAAGVLNPSFRGGFLSVGVGLFVAAGLMAGYFSAKVYRSFGGEREFRNALLTDGVLPAVVVPCVLVLDCVVWAEGSSTAVPVTTLLGLVLLWTCVQIPLVHLGSWYAFHRSRSWEHPLGASSIPRQIPSPQPWYLRTVPSVLLSGLIPFAVIFIELLYMFQSLWQDKSRYYYAFGFLLVVMLLLILAAAEVSLVATYVRLGHEDHKDWQWRAFASGAASAVYIFAYSFWYYFGKMAGTERTIVDGWLFFAYSAGGCAVYGVAMGTVGFLASYAFVRRIYRAIKVD
ncbi:endomembrane protein 70 domain-containing protein [Sarocladium implicatum]|nr:endomembrane protein 70 domain-containing protein [Sarocladium implicatum]